MTYKISLLFLLLGSCLLAQQSNYSAPYSHFIRPELLLGNPIPPSEFFPETSLGKGYFLNIGRYYDHQDPEWAYRTHYAKTGVSLGVTDYGNEEYVGYSYTIMPFTEFPIFGSKSLNAHLALGGSYFTRKYEPIENPTNDAIATDYTWSFQLFLQYSVLKSDAYQWNIGAGYFHHSNGHTKLPNLGLNSLMVSTSFQFNYKKNEKKLLTAEIPKPKYKRSVQNYFSIRQGFGANALSEDFNQKKTIATTAISFGKIYNRTFKFGIGFYHRYYEHYYDYIVNNEELIVALYPYFLENPKAYAKNYGFSFNSEVLMNHIGLECQIGYNVYKPFYKVDRMLGGAYSYTIDTPDGPVTINELGKLDGNYELKRSISSRIGLKYYLLPTKEDPKYNIFFGAAINANGGQADFSEFSVGLVVRYNYKERPDKVVSSK